MTQILDAPAPTSSLHRSTETPRPAKWARLRGVARHPAISLALLTIVGAALRFWKLPQPALWGDEVATFRRVCGTFQQLVDQLAVGGFTPLHYLLYYWIGKHATLTPTMMRVPTAIFGTLLIPAMYFLARQLVRPPVAMLVAAFTACSAYQLNFARDAKMYSDLWLCGVVHMGCFFWWLRTRSVTAWWGWVAAGTAMMGVQFVGAALYLVEVLIVLTAPRGYWKNAWPMIRYLLWLPTSFAWLPIAMLRRRRDRGLRRPSVGRGFHVLPLREAVSHPSSVDGSLSLQTPLSSSGGMHQDGKRNSVMAWWIGARLAVRHWRRRRRRLARFAWPTLALFLIGLGIAAAAPYAYYAKFNRFFSEVYPNDQQSFNWFRTGITWVGGYNDGRGGFDLIRYTATAYTLGWEWPRTKQWAAVDERTGKLLIGTSGALLSFALLGALPFSRRWVWYRRRSLLWIGMWLILPAYAFYCASMPEAASPLTWMEQLVMRSIPIVKWPALPTSIHGSTLHEFWSALTAGSMQLRQGLTASNLNTVSIALLCIAVLAWAAATLRLNRRSLFVASQTVMTLLGILLLCVVLRIAIASPFPRSVWMPRYLAFVWPAFAILLAALFYRLPTRPIRWAGIAVLLISNLSVNAARVLAGSEPPTDWMARDVVDCQPPLHSRLFSTIPMQGGSEPGTGVLESMPARYYLALLSGKPIGPDQVRGFGFESQFLIGKPRLLMSLTTMVTNAIKDKSIDRLVVWEQLQPKQVSMIDPLEKVLPDSWRQISQTDFVGRDHWTWTDYYVFRRHVYDKR